MLKHGEHGRTENQSESVQSKQLHLPMKKLCSLFLACTFLIACNGEKMENPEEKPETPNGEVIENPGPEDNGSLGGYAEPNGVLILSRGTYTVENAFLSYIAPDGTIEADAYSNVNGTELGNDGAGLYMCNGKLFILCNDWRSVEGKENNDGLLTIADAKTLQKEKSFRREEMKFAHPVNDEPEEVDENMKGIAVLDEQNIFIIAQGVLRFDSTTGELTLIEGAYEIGNKGSANTVESIISPRGILAVGDCLYAAAGGFWSTTALLEFAKGKNEVNRRLELGKGDQISGICLTDNETLAVGTYTRGKNTGYLYFIDLKSWTIKEQKTIPANISAGSGDTSGITCLDGYIYFTGAEETEFTSVLNTTVSRYSLDTGRTEKDIINIKADEPDANLLDCGLVADPNTGYIYAATSKERWEGVVPESNILIYDCNGEKPELIRNISDITHHAENIYPMSKFTNIR